MAIPILTGFDVLDNSPIDGRYIVASETLRNAIDRNSLYEGIQVYVEEDKTVYILTNLGDEVGDDVWSGVLKTVETLDLNVNATNNGDSVYLTKSFTDTTPNPDVVYAPGPYTVIGGVWTATGGVSSDEGGTTANALTDGDGIADFTFNGSAAATVSVDFPTSGDGNNGTATTASRSDHTHAYTNITGHIAFDDFPTGGSENQVLKATDTNGTVKWANDENTTYTVTENTDTNNLEVKIDGSSTANNTIPLGARQATFIPGSTDEQGIFLSLTRNGEGLPSGSAEFVNTVTRNDEMHVEESPYIDWEVAGGRGALNSTGLHDRFDDTYRKAEIESWVEHDIPVTSKPAIQYYEVLGTPNFDSSAPVGTTDAERVEFSEFKVDLGLARRTGAVSDYHSKAISFSLNSDQANANAGHWTVSVGAQGHIFVIKDDVYKEFTLEDQATGVTTDLVPRCVAFDPLSIPGAHDNQFLRIGCEQGVIYSIRLSQLNADPNVQRSIGTVTSRTLFTNEAITAISVGYHFDSSNEALQTIAFGTSRGHVSYISNRIAGSGMVLSDYISDEFRVGVADEGIFPVGVTFPSVAFSNQAYTPQAAKDGVWVRDIKWIGQAGEFIAVGNHQASLVNGGVGQGIPGDILGCPLIAYFRGIQADSFTDIGTLYYLNTPFREEFFDNIHGSKTGSSLAEEPLGFEPTGQSSESLPTLNQLFGTAFTSVVPVTIGSDVWVYLFGKRDIHVNNQY